MAHGEHVLGGRCFTGIAFALGALLLFSSPHLYAGGVVGSTVENQRASASLRVTLEILPRAEFTKDAAGADQLCLRHIPVRFLHVNWIQSTKNPPTGAAYTMASLSGSSSILGCILLNNVIDEDMGSTGYLQITAE